MKSWARYLSLFALALAIRLAYLSEWHDTALFSVLLGDAAAYNKWAQQIAAGGWMGKEVFYQAPFYPYFLSTLYFVFGTNLLVPRIVQAVIGSLACCALAGAGKRLFSEKTAWVAGILLALSPAGLWFDGLVQKASPSIAFTSFLLLALASFQKRPARLTLLVAGLLLGCFALTRENALLFVPLGVLWLLLGFRETILSKRMAWAGVLLAGTAMVLVPVGARNYALGGRFQMTTAQAGPNFYIGNNANANGGYAPLRPGRGGPRYERDDARELAESALRRKLSPGEVSQYWFGRARTDICARPAAWLRLLLRKLFLVLNTAEIEDTDSIEAYAAVSRILRILNNVLHFGVLLPMGIFGLWLTRRQWRHLLPVYGLAGGTVLGLLLFYVMGRYRAPLVPVLCLLSGAGLAGFPAWVRNWRSSEFRVGLALMLAVVAVSNWPRQRKFDPRAVTYYALGVELASHRRFAEAAEYLERALVFAPSFVDAYVMQGDLLFKQGELPAAIAKCERALALDAGHVNAHVTMGRALQAAGRVEEAAAHFRLGLRGEPDNRIANNNLACLLLLAGRAEEAFPFFLSALEVDPGNADTHANLANCLLSLGRAEQARQQVAKALDLNSEHLVAKYVLALIEIDMGNHNKAVRTLMRLHEEANGRDPKVADAVRELLSRAGVQPARSGRESP